MMPDDYELVVAERYTPEELVELLGVTTEELISRFRQKLYQLDWREVLDWDPAQR